jgi:hypothetical protein
MFLGDNILVPKEKFPPLFDWRHCDAEIKQGLLRFLSYRVSILQSNALFSAEV